MQITYLLGVDDECDVAVHVGGELAECGDDAVLAQELVCDGGVGAHHELQVVDDHVCDVMHVHRVRHRL